MPASRVGGGLKTAPCYVQTLLTWVTSQEIAIPEIQRPFVWDAIKVRNLLDSLFRGFPIGYLIAWKTPNVRLKDGSAAAGTDRDPAAKSLPLLDSELKTLVATVNVNTEPGNMNFKLEPESVIHCSAFRREKWPRSR
jgi:Protein of unknown function DUF262